jgi:hypothetical protein
MNGFTLLAPILTRTEFEVRVNPDMPPSGSKPPCVTVIDRPWRWEYVYDDDDGQDLGFVTANERHVWPRISWPAPAISRFGIHQFFARRTRITGFSQTGAIR